MSKGTYSHSNRPMEDDAEDLTTAYMLGVHDGRKAAKLNHQTNDNMNNELLTKTQREAWNSSHEISKLKKENTELKKENAELKRTLSDIMYTLSTIMDYQQPTK
jgi:predicted RNase H-like nuclease (RuvC/YqgF family)